jgi:hypothetical protein
MMEKGIDVSRGILLVAIYSTAYVTMNGFRNPNPHPQQTNPSHQLDQVLMGRAITEVLTP